MIGNHLVHDMVGNQPGGLQRSVRLLKLGPTPLESRVVIYHANISILIVISSANYTWNTFLPPCLFLAIIKERYEEDFGYQYMCNFPLFTSQIQRHLNDQFSSASRQRRN